MKSVKGLFAIVATAISLAACNHEVLHPVVNDEMQTSVKGETVDLTVDWVKNKDNSIDMLVWIDNRTQKSVYTTGNSYRLSFAGTDFIPRAGQGLVQIPAGQKMKVLLVFQMPIQKDRAGKAVLNVNPIFQGSIDAEPKVKLSAMKVDLMLTGKAVH